jgi:hypothetical protein
LALALLALSLAWSPFSNFASATERPLVASPPSWFFFFDFGADDEADFEFGTDLDFGAGAFPFNGGAALVLALVVGRVTGMIRTGNKKRVDVEVRVRVRTFEPLRPTDICANKNQTKSIF